METTMMSVKDVSEVLGIGINQAYALVRKDDFPKIRINKQYLIPQAKFSQWIEKNMNQTISV